MRRSSDGRPDWVPLDPRRSLGVDLAEGQLNPYMVAEDEEDFFHPRISERWGWFGLTDREEIREYLFDELE